jgi:hypothetical protein
MLTRPAIGHFIDLELNAEHYQLINIKIYSISGERKIMLWEELNKGENRLTIDVTSLMKGTYRVTIAYLNNKLAEERFTLY